MRKLLVERRVDRLVSLGCGVASVEYAILNVTNDESESPMPDSLRLVLVDTLPILQSSLFSFLHDNKQRVAAVQDARLELVVVDDIASTTLPSAEKLFGGAATTTNTLLLLSFANMTLAAARHYVACAREHRRLGNQCAILVIDDGVSCTPSCDELLELFDESASLTTSTTTTKLIAFGARSCFGVDCDVTLFGEAKKKQRRFIFCVSI